MKLELDRKYFKSDEVFMEWDGIKEHLKPVLIYAKNYCEEWAMGFLITDLTSTEAEDRAMKRETETHRDGRAADIRCRDWPIWFREQFEKHMEEKFKDIAAKSSRTLKCNLIEIHIGNEIHVHLQVRRI